MPHCAVDTCAGCDHRPAPAFAAQLPFHFLAILPVECIVQYKENCALVIIDWFIRQGYITPDMPGYLELLRGLRSGDCS